MKIGTPGVLALAVAATFGCSAGGGGGGGSAQLDYIPDVVLGGGGGTLSLQLAVNQPAVLIAGFSQYDETTDEEDGTSSRIELEPGSHSFGVQVPADAYLYFELGVPDAQVGATAEWTLSLDGKRIWSESDRLEAALHPGYAFFLQIEADGLDDLRAWSEY